MPTVINMSSGPIIVSETLEEILTIEGKLTQLMAVNPDGTESPIVINVDQIASATNLPSSVLEEVFEPPREIL